jgi:acyl carrier protein
MSETGIATSETIASIIKQQAGISDLKLDEDFYDAGLTSLASLNLLLELEDRFNVSIADAQFIACRTVNDLASMIEGLQA